MVARPGVEFYEKLLNEKANRFIETFWTAPSPGIVASAMQNDYYGSLEEYVNAVAEALRTEYEAIVARGHVLQIDAPDLAMERHRLFADRPLAEFLGFVDLTVAALNRALAQRAARPRAAARVLGQLRGPAHLRRAAGGSAAASVSPRA